MIYIDKDYKCHVSDDGTMTPIETDVFDGKPDAYIEGFRFIPKGESWTREDGVVLRGEMIAPWQDMRILEAYQNQYEVNLNEIEDLRDKITVVEETIGTLNTVTAQAGDVLIGKAYVSANGITIKGMMPNRGTVHETLDIGNDIYYIPEGYHSGSGTIRIVLEGLTVTPDKESHTISPSTGKVFGEVTINPIPDVYITTTDATATANDILSGKTAYVNGTKVAGSMVNNGAINKAIDGLTTSTVTIPAGFTTGGTVSLTSDIEARLSAI